jgi:hypothetical protein
MDIERQYMHYLSRHNKSYATREEYDFRFAQFVKNMKLVEEHNSMNEDGETLGPNHMADWTDDEYSQLLGYKDNRPAMYGRMYEQETVNLEDLPTSVNWVENGAVTPVKN